LWAVEQMGRRGWVQCSIDTFRSVVTLSFVVLKFTFMFVCRNTTEPNDTSRWHIIITVRWCADEMALASRWDGVGLDYPDDQLYIWVSDLRFTYVSSVLSTVIMMTTYGLYNCWALMQLSWHILCASFAIILLSKFVNVQTCLLSTATASDQYKTSYGCVRVYQVSRDCWLFSHVTTVYCRDYEALSTSNSVCDLLADNKLHRLYVFMYDL